MRLCFVTSEYVTEPSFSGGLANYLGRVTSALSERGHEVHVLTRSERHGRLDHRGVQVHRVVPLWDRQMRMDHVDPLVPRRYYNVYQDIKAAWSLWRYWKKLRRSAAFDLVQVANVMGVGLFFRYERGVPVVTRLSSYRPLWDTLADTHNVPGARVRWKIERWSIRGTRFIYAPSHFVADLTRSNYKVPKIDVIETPFFQEEVQPDRSVYDAHLKDQPYLLFFGRMTQMKGVHILAEALVKAMERLADLRAVFIGGSGPAPDGQPMEDWLRQRLARFSDRVRFHQRLRHDQLYPIVEHARIVALPSLADNLPNTCLEAMGLGRLVIATTGSCFDQLITDGKSGLLVPPGDVDKLVDAIIRAWRMPEAQRCAMGQAARNRMAELHPDRAVPRLIDYYQSVIEQFAGNGRTR